MYVDDSGSAVDPNAQLLILAGFSIFERQTHWLERKVDEIAARFDPSDPRAVEIHGSPMYGGRGEWRSIPRADRHTAMTDALTALCGHPHVRLFGVAVDVNACTEDPIALAFEHLCSMFDRMLVKCHARGDHQRGLMIFDKHKSEEAVQRLARDFKEIGHRWGNLHNMAEVPVFIDSRASRLIQLSDLVAFAMKRHFANKDSTWFDVLDERFYREGRRKVGLATLPAQAPLFSSTVPNEPQVLAITTTTVESIVVETGPSVSSR